MRAITLRHRALRDASAAALSFRHAADTLLFTLDRFFVAFDVSPKLIRFDSFLQLFL